MRTPDFYLVIDLEATCDDRQRIPRDESEIIEIGAVLLSAETREPCDELQTFVRPVRHPTLTPFCRQLTSITQADVDGAPPLAAALAQLAAFVDGRDALFCSWGDYDRAQLRRQAQQEGLRLPLGEAHWNLKEAFLRRSRHGRSTGVRAALRHVGLHFVGTAHRGIDDARNIARLVPLLLDERAPLRCDDPAERQRRGARE